MQKDHKQSKEQKENDLKNKKSNEVQTEKENIDHEPKKDKPQEKDPEPKEKELEMKSKLLNKPKKLLEFDAVSHFKENIHNTDKNSISPITEKSYYCIDCKHSQCPLYKGNKNQKEHLLIKRSKCLLYNPKFFDTFENSIKEAINYNQYKGDIKQCLTNSINALKNELDNLKEKKFQEIDNFFEETEKYILDLKTKCNNVKKSLEDYYKTNKKFFNIELSKDTINENNEKNLTKTDFTSNNVDFAEMNNGTSNRDIENTVFLLNFEIMNLCETRNLELMNKLKNIKNHINEFNKSIQNELNQDIDIVSKFFNIQLKNEAIDDHYWDIMARIQKYSDMIHQFRETITDIVHRTGNLDKIKDLIDIFDSKLKKNNKAIFGQKYFKENDNVNNNNKNKSPTDRSPHKRNVSTGYRRANSKTKLYSTRGKSANKLKKNYGSTEITKNNMGALTLSNNDLIIQRNQNQNSEIGSPLKTYSNLEHKKTSPNTAFLKKLSFQNIVPEDIILNQRVIERFFAYSISELFSKNFVQLDPDDEANYTTSNKDNIYLNKNKSNINNLKESNLDPNKIGNTTQISKNKNAKGNNDKKNKNMNNVKGGNKFNTNNSAINSKSKNYIANLKNPTGLNNNNNNNINNNIYNNVFGKLEPDQYENGQYNVKSVSYLANYTNRYNSLKEIAKPIIGTNQIQLFSPFNHKIERKTTTLNREEHGYSLFPEGCRHILVEDHLYIIGGTNHVRIPISIVLSYNIISGELKKLPDLNTTHSYHSVEYLDNFDSIICIGGENSSSCEIMNLENKKWYKLPSLNIPRANCNIYFNNITGELFVLFGICGIMSEKTNNYCDSIEVLVLNDINQGWLKVDYYKTPGLNLKVNYCITAPYTKNQLLIYGGSNIRSLKNIFALFHMIRSECIKVDTQTMELIKLEEKKSRLVDLALTKLG